jgi:hypothetical protein
MEYVMRSLIFVVCFAVSGLTFGSHAAAQAREPEHARSVSQAPRTQLTPPEDAAESTHALAGRALHGPVWKIAGGTALIGVAAIAGMLVSLSGTSAGDCIGSPRSDLAQCERDAERKDRSATMMGVAVAVPLSLLGGALIGFGARDVHRIRQARRALTLASLDVGRDHANLTFSLRF